MSYDNLSEISAEMLLYELYPEWMDEWIVRFQGTFYRNYSDDTMRIDPARREISLSRNGWLNLLPTGLISEENELRQGGFKGRYEKIKERVALLKEQFLPFDSLSFRHNLHLERQLSEALESKERFILQTWFGIDLDSIASPLVRELALTLPYLKDKRGNAVFVRDLLAGLLNVEVRLIVGVWSESDTSRRHIPWLRYEIIRDGLDEENWRAESERLAPAADFIREWFLPVEARVDIAYKSFQAVDELQILDYNSMVS